MSIKDDVLYELKKTEGYVSGKELSEKLDVTRAAIWKGIQSLKELGYQIDSRKSVGYKLMDNVKRYTESEVEVIVRKSQLFETSYLFDEIDSTNKFAKSIDDMKSAIVLSKEQTKGRGRLGRTWVSAQGQGLYMTLKLHPTFKPDVAGMITQLTGLAVLRALRELDIQSEIKWPNDLVYNGRKLGGILTEMITEMNRIERLIVGIGINIRPVNVEDKGMNPISISEIVGSDILEVVLLEKIIEKFETLYYSFHEELDLGFVKEELNEASAVVGKQIKISTDPEAVYEAIEISKDGNLIVKDENGTEKEIYYGEISVRGLSSYI